MLITAARCPTVISKEQLPLPDALSASYTPAVDILRDSRGRVGRGMTRVPLGVGLAGRLVQLQIVAVRILERCDASPRVIADVPSDVNAAIPQRLDGRL